MLQVHIADISATVVSSIRLENPHSLSYQLDTLTRRPVTFVSVASKIDERASWLKSLETSGIGVVTEHAFQLAGGAPS